MAIVIGWTIALAVGMVITGWAIATLMGIRSLRGRELESFLGRAFLGTGCWILGFGLCSHLGASVADCRIPFAIGFCAIVLAALVRSRRCLKVRFRRYSTIVFLVACALALALTHWPLIHCAAVWPFNDTLAYCSISNWLQDQGFGSTVVFDPNVPATRFVDEFQTKHWRMGSTFLLALVQGYSGLDPLLAFPVVMGWGMLLNLGGIYLLIRWGLRLDRWIAASASLCAAAALNPLYTSIHQGFQPQMFGTAYLLAALALLCRARHTAFWSRGNAFFLAATVAAFVSVYSEMAPILALIAVFYGLTMRTGNRRTQWLRFAGWTLLFLVLLGNIEWYRAFSAIRKATGITVGYSVSWSDLEFLGFASGQLHFHHRDGQLTSRLPFIGFALLFLALGFTWALRNKRLILPAAALLILIAMAAWFRLGTVDRWSLFKVAKWAFPVLLVFQFVGIAMLLHRWRLRPMYAVLPGILAVALSYTHHREYNQWAGRSMREVTGSARPTEDWRELRAQLEREGVTAIYIEGACRTRELGVLMPNALYPLPFVNGWKGSELEEARLFDGALLDGTAILIIGSGSGERLPGNLTLKKVIRHAPVEATAAAGHETANARNSTSR